MIFGKQNCLLLSLALFAAWGCARPLTVSKNEYIQYGIEKQLPEDSSIVKYYLPFREKMQAEMGRIVGQTDQELTKPAEPETLMGNFFADALLKEGLKKDPSIQFFLATRGGLRTTFPKGDITVSHVFELMPFENELVVLKLTGADVQKAIDFIAEKKGQPVAGITMKIRSNSAYDVSIAGAPFDPSRTYHVLTYDYLADGAEGLEFLRGAAGRRDIGQKVRDALLANIEEQTREGKKINAQLDGRIVVIKN